MRATRPKFPEIWMTRLGYYFIIMVLTFILFYQLTLPQPFSLLNVQNEIWKLGGSCLSQGKGIWWRLLLSIWIITLAENDRDADEFQMIWFWKMKRISRAIGSGIREIALLESHPVPNRLKWSEPSGAFSWSSSGLQRKEKDVKNALFYFALEDVVCGTHRWDLERPDLVRKSQNCRLERTILCSFGSRIQPSEL